MNLDYLSYLADTGATYLHPGGQAATSCSISSLNLKENHRVLEIGCGTGVTLVQIALSYLVSIDGVDILPKMLRVARKRLILTQSTKKVKTYQPKSNSTLPFSDQMYDRVYCESVIGFQDACCVKSLFKEIFLVLKKGGLFGAIEGCGNDPCQ